MKLDAKKYDEMRKAASPPSPDCICSHAASAAPDARCWRRCSGIRQSCGTLSERVV